jgi:enamine deaminase RidA (YjgF/YER057c/UK114 family)
VVDDVPVEPAFDVFIRAWAGRGPAPLITMARVAGLAHPAFLMELHAIAVPTGT